MDELIFARGACADLALMNEGEAREELRPDLRTDAGVTGSMVECALRIVLGIGEWPRE